MIVNFDQTGLNIVPTSSWTLDQRGAKQVEITGLGDKRQITAVLACSMTGTLLPLQLIYAGTTTKCHPPYAFPPEFHITHSATHWSTSETMEQYVVEVLVPYFARVREEEGLPSDQPGVCLLDVFRAHRVETVLQLFSAHNINVIFVPANCTGDLQPLDLSGNNEFKTALKSRFITWFAGEVADAKKKGEAVNVDFRLSVMKPMHAARIHSAWTELMEKKDAFCQGWKAAGIMDALNEIDIIIG
jgi:hypothetical protein